MMSSNSGEIVKVILGKVGPYFPCLLIWLIYQIHLNRIQKRTKQNSEVIFLDNRRSCTLPIPHGLQSSLH